MKLRPFELALVIIFGSLALLAMILLVGYSPSDDDDGPQVAGTLQIWGTLPAEPLDDIFRELTDAYPVFTRVAYTYFDPDEFDDAFINALASRRQPDMLLISHERIVEHRDKLYPIPYENFALRDYRNLFVDGTELFAFSDGIYAFPVAIDPLMMYWNRDILSTYSYLEPPATWEELVSEYAPTLTARDDLRRVQRSTVAMGTFNNVTNPVATLSMLLIQGGSLLVTEDDGDYTIRLAETPNTSENPLQSALRFYTRFADPTNPLYSWNRSRPNDREAFIAEELAFYFGFGSEAVEIEALNPNLNFDIAEVPQGATASVRRTYGKHYGFALVRTATNLSAASQIRSTLVSGTVGKQIADAYDMAPAQREALAQGDDGTYGRLIYTSAPVARGWLNPDMDATIDIFGDGVEDINSNRAAPTRASTDISRLLYDEYF